jgi:outer membrane immunogenic protein
MKKYVVAVAFAAMLVPGSALAADVEIAPAYDWSGFYIGADFGFGGGGSDEVGLATSGGYSDGSFGNVAVDGVFGGLQAGWDFQTGSLVFGIVADGQFSDLHDHISSTRGTVDVSASSDVDFFGTLRGRAGFAADRALFYVTGGGAIASVDYDLRGFDGALTALISNDETRLGYAVGGGVEYAIDDAWTLDLEYQYLNFGKHILDGIVVNGAGVPTGETARTNETVDFHTVRLGVNCRF